MTPHGHRAEHALAPQLAILVIAAVLAAVGGAETIAAIAAAYFAGWAIVSIAIARGRAWPRAPSIAVLAVAIAWPLLSIARRVPAIADAELLIGLDEHTTDRLRLERAPQIHPAIVLRDRPQLFFVHAPGAGEVHVRLGELEAIEAEPLGHGVFRLDYDPARHGHDGVAGSHPIDAEIVVDGARSVRRMRSIDAAPHPRWLRVSPDRARACTTSEETGELYVIDRDGVASFAIEGGLSDCAFVPAGIAVARRWARAIDIVDARGAPIGTVDLGTEPIRIAADDRRIAAIGESGEVVVLESAAIGESGEVAALESGAVGESDKVVALESGEVMALESGANVGRHRASRPDWVAIDGEHVIVAERTPPALTWIGARDRRSIALRAPAVSLALARIAGAIVIATTDHAAEGELPRAHLGNHYVQDQLVSYDLETAAITRHLLTAGRSPRQDSPGGLDRGVSPLGIDEGPDGSLCVAFAGSDELAIVPPAGPIRWIDAARAGLSAPCSCAILADRSIVATSPSSGVIAILSADGAPRRIERLAPDDASLLRDDPDALRVRMGERAFYETTRAGISCQSCHLHGASDGLAHNIGGRVLAPTLDVRGIAGTSPYLRDGSYPRIRDLHLVADEIYRGYQQAAGDRGATIEAWLETAPPPLPLGRRDPESERRGLSAFVRAECPSCHTPPAFTDLGRHPVRAIFPDAEAEPGASIDTPSLRGVSRRPALLFDGRARSIEEVLEHRSRGGRHGRVDRLSEAERRDLVAFLESI